MTREPAGRWPVPTLSPPDTGIAVTRPKVTRAKPTRRAGVPCGRGAGSGAAAVHFEQAGTAAGSGELSVAGESGLPASQEADVRWPQSANLTRKFPKEIAYAFRSFPALFYFLNSSLLY